jgi:AcrR family transcriptional regulator
MIAAAKPRPDATRTRLLSAAEQILIEQGVHALTVRRIGTVSGLNGTLVTYHFGTVAGLLAELARCNLEPMLADWATLPGKAGGINAILDAWLRPLLRPAAFHAGGRALIVLDEIAAHGSAPASGEVMAAMVAISERVRTALRPHLPALDDATLRARLRFIAGAALGPPPRVPAPNQSAPDQTMLPQHAQLLEFAAAALG